MRRFCKLTLRLKKPFIDSIRLVHQENQIIRIFNIKKRVSYGYKKSDH